ncbi:hypothetical protein BD770DRAFT_316637 [Pilaira anomala]|nr:hypothetical protein BD770DRAFT_316637 [Pilaira anomala]
MAAEKGDSGAEAIALEIGSYMGECIEIIEHFGGDVVKFLGDAVLVSFQSSNFDEDNDDYNSNDDNAKARQKNVLVRRAVECGLQLLARLSHYRVYLTAEERTKHKSSITGEIDRRVKIEKNQRFYLFEGGQSQRSSASSRDSLLIDSTENLDNTYAEEYSTAFNFWNCLPILFGKSRKNKVYASRRASDTSDTTREAVNSIDLELHIALSCGDLTNIILGDLQNTPPPSNNDNNNNNNKDNNPRFSYASANGNDDSVVDEIDYIGRLEYAICGPVVESLEDALSAAKAGEMSITPEAYDIFQNQSMMSLYYEKRKQFYVVKSSDVGSNKKNSRFNHGRGTTTPNASYLSTRPGLMNRAATLNIEPLIPRTRNASHFELSSDPDPYYFKYLNRSALYRLQHSPEDNFPAQFRDVTIMFISLGKLNVATPEGLQIAQRASIATIEALVKYEGVLQQFAVDDKGATLLAVFGLPPLSHEREAVFAAKAAIELREKFVEFLEDFSISLSTGVIFNSVLPQGNPYRRDPAIAGDTIILAVRMLKFPFSKKNIVCDFATKQQIGRTCEFEDYGENFVKGKVKPIHLYGIIRFATLKTKRISTQSQQEKNSDFIGYKSEMGAAMEFVDDWSEAPNHHLLVIAGPSGVGKSFFCHALCRTIGSHGTVCCWSSSTEVEKSSKYYLVKNILLALFEIIDSNQVPQNAKRRVSYLTGSGAIQLNESATNSHAIGEFSTNSSTTSVIPSPTTTKETGSINNSHVNPNRLTRYSTRSSIQDNGNQSEVGTNEIAELIVRCLRICGEEDGFLPLFKVVFNTLTDVEDNRYTQRLDGRGRDILLTGLVTRMVRYVSEHVGLVFISDDIQWADSASIRLLQHIHEQCQRVMLVLATRPVKDYNVGFINNFRETGYSQEIELNGLGAAEIGEIILQTFQTAGVKSVSPEIVHVIQKRTAGNPLYVKNMAIVLKDFNHVTVVECVLVPSNNQFDLEDLLGNFDYKRIIKMQFDRLEGSFQEFLTVASCLDQYFTIEEVQSVIKDNNTDFKDTSDEIVREKIEKYDVYHFIQKVDDNILETGCEVFTFSHITIPQSIYDMVSYETRILLHRLLAKYYESEITRENYADLLGKVTRHYLQTDWLDKQLYFLEALADLNMKSYLLPEATANLERIVKILDENEDLAARFGSVHRSDIYRRLGMCFTMRTKLNEGEHFLFQALECIGEPWPRSEPEFLYKFWVNRLAQFRHRKLRVFRKIDKNLKREIGNRVVKIMAQLSNIYFYTGKGRAFVYTCLVGLNACERLNEKGANYTMFLARNSLLSWLNDEKEQSVFYITKAIQLMDKKIDADTLNICSHLCFASGKFKKARDLLYQSIDAVKTLGVITDCQAFYRSVGLVITMRIFEGTLDNSPDDLMLLKQMADTAHSNCDFEAEIWLGVYNIGNALIMDRLRECEPFVALLENHLKQQPADYNKIAIYGTLMCYYARTRNYEHARRHTKSLVAILPLLTVTPNIFPIFGLIFATMGMYCMVEDAEVDFVSTGDSKNYDRFILGVSRINHAFQQVKFWEFTQPCLYLARALPYISTGRTVEGFMVLQHGVLEMRYVQEIRFLKSFYWANLGKYAFTPADRIEWTQRAKADFDDLKIPSHVYCNPDPANLYSRDTPADLTA